MRCKHELYQWAECPLCVASLVADRILQPNELLNRDDWYEMKIGDEYYAIAPDGHRWGIFQLMAGGFQFLYGFPTIKEAEARLIAMRVTHE